MREQTKANTVIEDVILCTNIKRTVKHRGIATCCGLGNNHLRVETIVRLTCREVDTVEMELRIEVGNSRSLTRPSDEAKVSNSRRNTQCLVEELHLGTKIDGHTSATHREATLANLLQIEDIARTQLAE